MFAFHIMLMLLKKAWIRLLSSWLCLVGQAEFSSLDKPTNLREGKTLTFKLTLYHILLIVERLGKYMYWLKLCGPSKNLILLMNLKQFVQLEAKWILDLIHPPPKKGLCFSSYINHIFLPYDSYKSGHVPVRVPSTSQIDMFKNYL